MSGIFAARRAFLIAGPLAGLAVAHAARGERAPDAPAPVPDEFPTTGHASAREIVGLSHGNLDAVRRLVERRPSLATAAYDWGFGDWETALGAASHTGQREIALLLIEHGARPDLFTFAMLGNLQAVQAAIEAAPALRRLRGPHGINLLRHALAGGEQAAGVAEYLRSLGDDEPAPSPALSDADRDACTGAYRFGPGPRDVFNVSVSKGVLVIARADASPRVLTHVGDLAFHPVGAPAARVRFIRSGPTVGSLEIHDPDCVLTAHRA